MTRPNRWVWFAIGTALASGHYIAQAQPSSCTEDRQTTIVFGNGMFNERHDAFESLEALKRLLLEEIALEGIEGSWSFELAYNENERWFEQLIEVAEQRIGADWASFWRALSGIEIIPDWMQEALADLATEADLSAFVNDEDLSRHLARYTELVTIQGSKVVLVAHSQGNPYANAAELHLREVDTSFDMSAIGFVGVATPADRTPTPDSPYTTFEEDKIIAAVRLLFPATLEGNVSIDGEDIDILAHGLTTAYLVVPVARDKIIADVFAVQSRLSQPALQPSPPEQVLAEDCNDERGWSDVDPPPCTEQTFAGTCVNGFFGPCWDREGICETDLDLFGSSSMTWSNGARIEMFADLSDLQAPTQEVTIIGSSGEVCGTGHGSAPGEPTCIGYAEYISNGKTLSYCIDQSGSMIVTCPDGTGFTTPATTDCVFGPDTAACGLEL